MIIRLLSIGLILLLNACTPLPQQQEITVAYQQGDLEYAEKILSEQIENEMPQENYTRSKNAVCLLLDRATTRFAMGDVDGAIEDYPRAIEALDFFDQHCLLETTGKIVFDDGCGAYSGSALEQVLARVYFALALLQQGDMNNAYALLRQAEEVQQRLNERCKNQKLLPNNYCYDNALAKYLFAVLSEQKQDLSNANILYQQAAQLSGSLPLILDLAKDGPRATILFVCHNGNAPFKISSTCDASVASAAALEVFLYTQGIKPAISSFAGIPIPVLYQSPYSQPIPTLVKVDNESRPLTPLLNVAAATINELEYNKPLIVARGLARFLIRRTTVEYAQQHDPCVGALVDFGLFIANANTKADTRAWLTLPSSVDIVRYRVSPGSHPIAIYKSKGNGVTYESSFTLDLKPNELCVINIFNIHPQITTILSPTKE